MNRSLLTLLALAFTCLLSAQNFTFSTQSKASFAVGNMGFNTVEGTVGGASGTATFEDGILTAIRGCMDAKTIATGNGTRDNHLRDKEEFFNTAETPSICFSADKVTFVGKNSGATTYKLEGTLTLRGESNPVVLTVIEEEKGRLVSTFTVERNRWGLGEGYPKFMIANDIEVQVDIHLE